MAARGIAAAGEYPVRWRRRPFRPTPVADKTRHGQIGFDRRELRAAGALATATARNPTLTNEIHELFQKDMFVFDDGDPPPEWDEAYEVMKPAFRLVSRWIMDKTFDGFWWSLGHGTVSELIPGDDFYDDQVEDQRKIEYLGISDSSSLDDFAEDVPHCFRRYAQVHQFRFRPLPHSWAETRSQSDPDGDRPHFVQSITILHEDFFHVSYSDIPWATKSQRLRFLYFLAVNLAHELAHLMWQQREAFFAHKRERYYGSVLDKEPYFYDSEPPHNELGIAWELFMFGGRLQPLNQSLSLSLHEGLVLLPMSMVTETYFWDPQCTITPLLTDWISDQFSEAWWQGEGEKEVARRPGHPDTAPLHATVNQTTDTRVFLNNTYDVGEVADVVAQHIEGGCPGHRLVRSNEDTWLLDGVVEDLWFPDEESE